MKVTEKQQKDSVDFMTGEIKTIIDDYGRRDPGSEGEIKALKHMEETLSEYCDEVKTESFPVYPYGFMGWVFFVPTFIMLAQILFFITPVISIISLIVALIPMIFEFVLYKPFVDKLTEKRTSGNVMGTLKPTGEVKRRIVLNGHSDTAYEWHWHRIGGFKLFLTIIALTLIGFLYVLFVNIAAIATTGPIGTPSGWVLYCGIASIAFIPGFICFYYFSDYKAFVPGANDNLTACQMSIAAIRYLKKFNIPLKNTEVVALITGSEEAGLRGAKFFAKNNPTYGKEDNIETIFVTFETLREVEHLVIYNRDMNGITANDKRVGQLVKNAGLKNDMNLKYGSVFCGATDAAAFSQAGLKATCIAGMNPNVQKYYHTRYDNYDNISEETLAKVLDITMEFIDDFDKNGLPEVEKK